nr:transposase [Brucella pituitosa]
MVRGDLVDWEWQIIAPLLPAERGRRSRPCYDNRRYFNGMLYVLRSGCPWRDMDQRYGKWNSVYVRFRRWAEAGLWDSLLETCVQLGLTDDWKHIKYSNRLRRRSGSKGGYLRKLLINQAAMLRQSAAPTNSIKDSLLALA